MRNKESVKKALVSILDRIPDDAEVVILNEEVSYNYTNGDIDIKMSIRYYEKPKSVGK